MVTAGASIFFGILCVINMALWGLAGLLGFGVWGEVRACNMPSICVCMEPALVM